MAHPQTEEEALYMDKTLWDYMMKKASNDLDALVTGNKYQEIYVGGESRLEDYNETIPDLADNLKKRNGLYPKDGYYKFYHPVTKEEMQPLKPTLMPHSLQSIYPIKQCLICFSSLKKPLLKDIWKNKTTTWCHQELCTRSRSVACPCVFNREPTFNVRGLCSDAVMDTSYKLNDHQPMDPELLNTIFNNNWGDDDTRSYVGPKGWIIARGSIDKL